jgi:hypothetical protein
MLRVEYTHGSVVLPDGVQWPTLHSPVLFVRDFYEPFYDSVLNGMTAFKPADTGAVVVKKVILCGNPGIGKSAFGMYALFRAVRDGRTVVYASAKLSPKCYVFRNGAVYAEKGLDNLAQFTADPETVLICDSMIPPVCEAFTLLVTSPRKDRWHEFNKEMDCTMLFFPVFTLDEIRACRDECFSGVDDAGMMSRFARWGGIPRYVLAKLKAADQQQLEDAVNSTTLDSVIEHSGALELKSDKDMSHRLLHIKVAGETDASLLPSSADYYCKSRNELASKYVAELVVHAAMNMKHSRVLAFLYGSSGTAMFSVLHGQLFEPEALRILARGGDFPIRRLRGADGKDTNAASDEHLRIPPCELVSFGSMKALVAQLAAAPSPTVVYVPESKSFCAVDAILPGSALANATVSANHESIVLVPKNKQRRETTDLEVLVEPPGLLGLVQALRLSNGPIRFYWLLPEDVYPHVTRARSLSVEGKVVKLPNMCKEHAAVARRVEQYALCVRLQPESSNNL